MMRSSAERDRDRGRGREDETLKRQRVAAVFQTGNKNKTGRCIEASESEDMDGTLIDSLIVADDIQSDDNKSSPIAITPNKDSFLTHVSHILSKEELENLSKRKCRFQYQCEVAAFGVSSSKWKGTGDQFIMDAELEIGYGLKRELYENWLDGYERSGGKDFHSSKQRLFFSLCNSYKDILHHNKKPFYLKGLQEDSNTMDGYIMHSLNHVFKSNDIIENNEAKLADNPGTQTEMDRDCGFYPPKVLFLLPFASIAYRVVRRLLQLTPSVKKIKGMRRLKNKLGVKNDVKVEHGLSLESGKKMSQNHPSKPSDFEALFGANNEDNFMLGITFTGDSIQLYSDIYSSDIIVASPLGLIMKIAESDLSGTDKKTDVDFLTSIEILVIDHADVISMQNWSHVSVIFEHLNKEPKMARGNDFTRARNWYHENHAVHYRQSIILSSYLTPEINASFNQCVNYEGKLKVSCEHEGVLPRVLIPVPQIFERFPVESLLDADDARFQYFIKKVFPKLNESILGGVMIFISSYFDYVRVRNFLKSQDRSFCHLNEYTKKEDVSRKRNWFLNGKHKIMLYTERSHFYHRYKIQGVKKLVIYSLPERKEFYPEIVNMIQESHDMSCTILFSRFDLLKVERIVGSKYAKSMLASKMELFAIR